MSVTLTQAELLATDTMLKGIIQTIINESPFMRVLPFITINGNSYKYNLQTTAAQGGWYLPNEQIAESVPIWAQRSVDLAELIFDADVDKFLAQVRSNEQELKASVIEQTTIDFKDEFEKQAILGYQSDTYSTKHMKGLMHLIAECESATETTWDAPNNTQVIAAGLTSTALTIDLMDELIDAVKPGKPDALLMSKRLRRKLNSLARAAGNNLVHDRDQLGYMVELYGGIPILVSDHVPDNLLDGAASIVTTRSYTQATTRASGYDNSAIFAVKWGERGLCGIQNQGIQIEDLGTLETKDATRTRIKWYVGMANFSKSSIAALVNVLDTSL